MGDRFGARGLDRRQSVAEHRGEDVVAMKQPNTEELLALVEAALPATASTRQEGFDATVDQS